MSAIIFIKRAAAAAARRRIGGVFGVYQQYESNGAAQGRENKTALHSEPELMLHFRLVLHLVMWVFFKIGFLHFFFFKSLKKGGHNREARRKSEMGRGRKKEAAAAAVRVCVCGLDEE